MTPNLMPERVKSVAPGVQIEQIATDVNLTYNPLTQEGLAVLNFRGVLFSNDVVAGLSGDHRTQVVLTTATHAASQFGQGLVDPVTGASLASVSAAGWMLYLKAMAASVYEAQYTAAVAASQTTAADEEGGRLPQRVE